MAPKTKLKAATNDFLTGFQKDPRLDGEAKTSELERVVILAGLAEEAAQQHGISTEELLEAISKPIMALKKLTEARNAHAG